MSAHGVPGAFSSALSLLWKGILIILSIFLLSKLFVYLFPDFGQSNIKKSITTAYKEKQIENESPKSEYAWNLFKPETWTYEAMLKRQEEYAKNNKTKTNYTKPILVPTIDEWNKKNNPAYKTNYYENPYNENTADSNNWMVDGSMWNNTETNWNQ
jgi:hypothetical protein